MTADQLFLAWREADIACQHGLFAHGDGGQQVQGQTRCVLLRIVNGLAVTPDMAPKLQDDTYNTE